jgi:hypothetical protein
VNFVFVICLIFLLRLLQALVMTLLGTASASRVTSIDKVGRTVHFAPLEPVVYEQASQLMVTFWLQCGCFKVAFWLLAFSCGCCAPTTTVYCGILCGILCGICGGIWFGCVAFWLLSGCVLFAVALVLLRMLVAVVCSSE